METQMTEVWWRPYAGIFAFGMWFGFMYLLKRRMNLQSRGQRRWYTVLCSISLLFIVLLLGTRWPSGVSPFESAFWMEVQLPFKSWVENWQGVLKTVLKGCVFGLFVLLLNRIAHRKCEKLR